MYYITNYSLKGANSSLLNVFVDTFSILVHCIMIRNPSIYFMWQRYHICLLCMSHEHIPALLLAYGGDPRRTPDVYIIFIISLEAMRLVLMLRRCVPAYSYMISCHKID